MEFGDVSARPIGMPALTTRLWAINLTRVRLMTVGFQTSFSQERRLRGRRPEPTQVDYWAAFFI